MIYKGEGLTDHIVVKDIEEHLLKQLDGYHQHDGTLIEDGSKPAEGAEVEADEEGAESAPDNSSEAIPEEKDLTAKQVFPCDVKDCEYVGKSETALRMHKLHGHKDK